MTALLSPPAAHERLLDAHGVLQADVHLVPARHGQRVHRSPKRGAAPAPPSPASPPASSSAPVAERALQQYGDAVHHIRGDELDLEPVRLRRTKTSSRRVRGSARAPPAYPPAASGVRGSCACIAACTPPGECPGARATNAATRGQPRATFAFGSRRTPCRIASYRDQWRSSVKRNSSLYCTRRSSNTRARRYPPPALGWWARVRAGEVAHLRRQLHHPGGVGLVRQTLMHVLISERHDGQPQREVLVQRVLVRVVRDVVHQKTRGATVEGAAAVVRHALELLSAGGEVDARGGTPAARHSSSRLRLDDFFDAPSSFTFSASPAFSLSPSSSSSSPSSSSLSSSSESSSESGPSRHNPGRARGRVLALALVAQHENVAVIAAGVLKVQRAMAVEDEHARALGKACYGGGLGRR